MCVLEAAAVSCELRSRASPGDLGRDVVRGAVLLGESDGGLSLLRPAQLDEDTRSHRRQGRKHAGLAERLKDGDTVRERSIRGLEVAGESLQPATVQCNGPDQPQEAAVLKIRPRGAESRARLLELAKHREERRREYQEVRVPALPREGFDAVYGFDRGHRSVAQGIAHVRADSGPESRIVIWPEKSPCAFDGRQVIHPSAMTQMNLRSRHLGPYET